MSQMLELPDPVYAALQEVAAASGMTPAAWIAARLAPVPTSAEQGKVATSGPGSLAERFKGRVGRIASGGKECLSENTGEKFTDSLEAKKRAGHL